MPAPTPSVNALTINAATANLIDSFNVPSGVSIVGQAGGTFDFRLGNGYLAMTALGDTLYGGTNGIATALAGNTTSTKKFLSQTGAGGVSAAPAWSTVTNSDVGSEPALGNPGVTGYVLSSTTGGARSWIAIPATGVTSVASGTGLTGGPITSTGTLSVTGPLLTLTNLADAAGWLHSTGANVFAWSTPSKTDVGLGNVTNVAQAAAGAVGSSGLTMSTSRLLGRATAATGAIEEITLGTNLSFTGTTLNAAGGGSFANPTANVSNTTVNGSASTAMRSDAAPSISTSAALQFATLGLGTAITGTHVLDIQAVNKVAAAFGDVAGSGALFYFNVPTGYIDLFSRNNHYIRISGFVGSSEVEWARFTVAGNLLIGGTSETGLTGAGGLFLYGTTDATSGAAGTLICSGGIYVSKKIWTSSSINTALTTDATTTATGSIITAGGMGVAKTIWATALHLPSSGFAMRDTSAAFDVTLAATSSTALGAGRTLTLDMVNADRTIKLSGSPTLADWFDQSVKTTDSPTFVALTTSAVAAVTTAAESWVGPSSTTGIYFKGGNVGIGTTTPVYPLDIRGATNHAAASFGAVCSINDWTGIFLSWYSGTDTYKKGLIGFTPIDGNVRGNMFFALNGAASSANATIADAVLTLSYLGDATFLSSIKTGAPTGGTAAAWKFGIHGVGSVQADIAGVAYNLITTEGIFGGLYLHDGVTAQTIATGATYVQLTGFNTAQGSNGQATNCTPDKTNRKITVGRIGKYLVHFSFSGSCNTSNATWGFVVFAAGAEQQNTEGSCKMANSADIQTCSGHGFVYITSLSGTGGDIDLRTHHDNGGSLNLTPVFVNLTATRVGD
jgi:hypothetical protein